MPGAFAGPPRTTRRGAGNVAPFVLDRPAAGIGKIRGIPGRGFDSRTALSPFKHDPEGSR